MQRIFVPMFLLLVISVQLIQCSATKSLIHGGLPGRFVRSVGAHHEHHSMIHSHLSRKVLERACAASKDTIDEIITCFTSNEIMMEASRKEAATACYKEAFGENFSTKEVEKHKEMICNNRDKFEAMTTCAYMKMAATVDKKALEKLTEAMVDVGLCIINALDG